MSLCKEKVKKMMNFRKVGALFIVNGQSTCQPQMFKEEQGYLSQCWVVRHQPDPSGKVHIPYTSRSLRISEVDQGLCDREPKPLFQMRATKHMQWCFRFAFFFA